jgi:hypothetical protein
VLPVGHETETDPGRLRQLAKRAQKLADGSHAQETKSRLSTAAAEFQQRAKEIEMDHGTGQ